MMHTDVQQACELLRSGGVILYPTDTIWGLGCDATQPQAVQRIFQIKQRAGAKSLITLLGDLKMLDQFFPHLPETAVPLFEASDTPLTLILPRAQGFASNVVAEDGSVGVRIPKHAFCQQLLKAYRGPIVSTSANLSDQPAPGSYAEISPEIRQAVDFVVPEVWDTAKGGKASSIIKLEMDGQISIIRA